MKTAFSYSAALALLAREALGFPALRDENLMNKARAAVGGSIEELERTIAVLNKKRDLVPRVGFNAAQQLVSTTGNHAFVPPGPGDLRGPCPGLNAMANHGYIPHNGIGFITDYITGTEAAFGMGADISTVLTIVGALEVGDLNSWSIGGAPPAGLFSIVGLLGKPTGLTGSHNKYETDASPTRGDLYERGDNSRLQMDQFVQMFNLQPDAANADYTVDLLQDFRAARIQQSILRNPFYFYGPTTGILVEAAPFFFIPRFMSNKSVEFPEGKLNQEILKSFFSITGEAGSFTYTPGHERIPDNWYKRAIGDEYTLPFFASDILVAAKKYPQFIASGGNTGKVNTFTGIDLGNLTGGIYNSQTLLEGNNLICFAFQALQAGLPDAIKPIVADVAGAVQKLTSVLGPTLQSMGCPQMENLDESAFTIFPGFTKLKTDGSY